MKTGALILASPDFEAGVRGSEELPVFLPMYPLGGTTVIKREIAAFRKEGLSPILVVSGSHKEVLRNHLSHNGVVFVEDKKYKEHSREDTLLLGLEAARPLMDRVIVLQVEYPVFSKQTLKELLQCGTGAVLTHEGKEGGLSAYIFRKGGETEAQKLAVDDPGILISLLEENGAKQAEAYVKAQRQINELRFRNRLVLSKEEDFFGPGVYQLLTCIDRTGSIYAAAKEMNMSYTKSWKMINKAEEEMGFPFLERRNGGKDGGSSTITEEGRLFMERYHALAEDMERMGRNFFDIYFGEFQ